MANRGLPNTAGCVPQRPMPVDLPKPILEIGRTKGSGRSHFHSSTLQCLFNQGSIFVTQLRE